MKTNKSYPQQLFSQAIRYEIPPYQRRYIWEQEKQWEPLWEDVQSTAEDCLEGRNSPHFMGAVVLDHRTGQDSVSQVHACTVVDGQQRLTTIQLLLDAVQEVVAEHGYSDSAGRLSLLVLNDKLYWGGESDNCFKIWPTIYDQEAFRYTMQNELPVETHRDSLIVQAHDYFKEQIALWLGAPPKEQIPSRVNALEYAVSGLLELVVIEIEGEEDANAIFETLNARGTPLLQSDLVRNFIMHRANIGNDADVAKQFWNFGDWWQQEIGRGFQARPRIDVFLNYWLRVRTSKEVKARAEFASFQRYAEKCGQPIEQVARDVSDLASVYENLENPEMWDSSYSTFLQRRAVMQVGVLTPVLLWLFTSGVPDDQIAKATNALESFLVRRMVCGLQARSYDQLFIGLLQRLRNSEAVESGSAVVKYLDEQDSDSNATKWPKNAELEDAFADLPIYNILSRGRLRLVLEAIEAELRTNKSETPKAPRNLTIEHIMPQGWRATRAHWNIHLCDPDVLRAAEARRDRLIHSMGNLTLTNSQLNSSMSNGSWTEKQAELRDHSVLFLNKDLLDNPPPIWDESSIADRAGHLFQTAIKVWPHADGFV